MQRGLIAVAVLLVAGFATWAGVLTARMSSLRSDLRRAQADVRTVKTLARSEPSNSVEVATLRRRLNLLLECLPDVQDELNSETYNSSTGLIFPTQTVSRHCSKILTGYGG